MAPPSASASASVSSNRKGLPTRRGQIKARIFKSIIKKVAAAVLIRRITAPMASEDPRSDLPVIPTTPPSSYYSSDG